MTTDLERSFPKKLPLLVIRSGQVHRCELNETIARIRTDKDSTFENM